MSSRIGLWLFPACYNQQPYGPVSECQVLFVHSTAYSTGDWVESEDFEGITVFLATEVPVTQAVRQPSSQ